MNRRVSLVLALATLTACAKHQPPPSNTVEPTTPAEGPPAARGAAPFTQADVEFLQGMIGHHAQAIQMAEWAPSHGASASIRALSERIVVAQNDEIAFSQRWLREHNQYVPPADPRGHVMQGMDHPMLMPGMLTPEQMAQLDAARGVEFDRLFLEFMIQHHNGALAMVDKLLAVPGAAENGPVYRFATDVHVDQTTEINRMTLMLADLKRSAQ
ncbi:MAG TPA: DUF305 domain-containing protein [Gemmatimonadales bacterium]|nr:DUF305 domain-containing protein [Gemmatimonadales bacterium]